MIDAVRNGWDQINAMTGGRLQEFVNFFTGLPGRFFEIGRNILQGLLDELASMWGSIMGYAQSLADNVLSTVRGALDIFSPSRKMHRLGRYTAQGFALGIKSQIPSVVAASDRMAKASMRQVSRLSVA